MNWRKRILIFLSVVAGAVLLALGFRPSPILVDAERVSRGRVEIVVEEEGRTRVRDRYVISAPLAAQARRIAWEVGDEVQAGEVIAVLAALPATTLDVRAEAEARARVRAAEAVTTMAEAELDAAAALAERTASELARLRLLAGQDVISRSELEQAETEADRAEAMKRSALFRVRTAEFDLEAAETALRFSGRDREDAEGLVELRAPVSGRLLRRFFQSARVVQPGESILEIGDPAALEVEVDVLSSDAVRLEPEMRVLLERWGSPEPLEGRVRRVEPVGFTKVSALGVEEQRVLIVVDLTSPPEQWNRLGHGYRVNARFLLWESEDVLRVPTSALFRHGEGWAVFTVREDRAGIRVVEAGQRGGYWTRIISGIEEGETVVVHPDRELRDGVRVRLRGDAGG